MEMNFVELHSNSQKSVEQRQKVKGSLRMYLLAQRSLPCARRIHEDEAAIVNWNYFPNFLQMILSVLVSF